MRFGTVAVVGRTNVGKSTFVNAAIGEELAIVSALPQTTRETLLAIVHREDAQIAFMDTPGLHRPRSELGRRMNANAFEAARAADVIVLVTDLPKHRSEPKALVERDRPLFELFGTAKCLLVINKIDLARSRLELLPLIAEYQAAHAFAEIVPTSFLEKDGAERVLTAIAGHLPEGPPAYDADTLTDRSTPYFVREFVRGEVLTLARGEVPHAVAVSIDKIEERASVLVIKATIHVEKDGQRRILVGRGGEGIKAIGSGARKRLEALYERKIFLELFVRVTPKWKYVPRQLAELGYPDAEHPSPDLGKAFPNENRRRRTGSKKR
jgi:GTP-binding protein Era